MAIRYTDMGLDAIGARDFVARQRTPTISQIVIVIISAFLIGISLVVSISSKFILISTLFGLFAVMGWYIIYQLMRSRDMMLATEFQNALFASAMGLHNKFCMIIKRDGIIVYLDRSFQGLFPDFLKSSSRSVDMLLVQGKVSKEESARVLAAIERGTYDKVIFDIMDAQGLLHRIVLSVEPITRPAGFIMLRGREFVEERTASRDAVVAGSTNMFSRSSVTLFAHIMESMKMGVYITSPTGSIVYCNPVLEEWLSYNEGEVVTRNLTIGHLIPQNRNEHITLENSDADGTVMLEKKIGGFVKAFLNQKVIYNDNGKALGCTAVVHLFTEEQDASKKKTF